MSWVRLRVRSLSRAPRLNLVALAEIWLSEIGAKSAGRPPGQVRIRLAINQGSGTRLPCLQLLGLATDTVAPGLNRTQLLPFASLRCPLVHLAQPH
jgi:hypothetical protein